MNRNIKNNIRLSVLALFAIVTLTACSDDDVTPQPVGPTNGLEHIDASDAGLYTSFYKPEIGYVGDPMPFYNEADQTFYLFYLQDWRDGRKNDHPIYYTTTRDYASFTPIQAAIQCGPNIAHQDLFIGTGSCVEHNGTYYFFYTGHNDYLTPKEKLMLATSPDLKTWTKQTDFEMVAPAECDQNNFRDPHVYYDPYRYCYVMLVTTIKNGRGCIARYTSSDLRTWTEIASFTEFESDAEILECPDIFQMGDKWYLTFSRINRDPQRKTFYRVANSPEGPWQIARDENGVAHETFDGLFFYAGKTASDGVNRYISGWCSTAERVHEGNELQWAGALISHKIVSDPVTGCLSTMIPDALDKKFGTSVALKSLLLSENVTANSNTYTVGQGGKAVFARNKASFRLTMTIDASHAEKFGLAFGASGEQENVNKILFNLADNHRGCTGLFMYNGADELNFTPLDVPANRKFNVTVIAEKSICTIYVNDQVAFTNRILKMNENPWMIFSDNGNALFSDIRVYE